MHREKRKDLFEAIGIIAIVASLLLLVFETRTNTASVRASAYQTWVSANADLNSIDENLSITLKSGFFGSRGLTEDSYMHFALWHYTFYQMAVATDQMFRLGAIDQNLWDREMNRAAGHLDLPGVREWWDAGAKTQFPAEFVELMETTESDIIRWDWTAETGFAPETRQSQ